MASHLDRLWPLTWLVSGLRFGRYRAVRTPLPRRFHNSDRAPRTDWNYEQCGSQNTFENDFKIDENPTWERFFQKTLHMRSAHACAVQTLIPACLYGPLSTNMSSGRPPKNTRENNHSNNIPTCPQWLPKELHNDEFVRYFLHMFDKLWGLCPTCYCLPSRGHFWDPKWRFLRKQTWIYA